MRPGYRLLWLLGLICAAVALGTGIHRADRLTVAMVIGALFFSVLAIFDREEPKP